MRINFTVFLYLENNEPKRTETNSGNVSSYEVRTSLLLFFSFQDVGVHREGLLSHGEILG